MLWLHIKQSIAPALLKKQTSRCSGGLLASTTMASQCEPIKQRRYDPSMSRRTRKPTSTTTTKSSQDEDKELQKKSNDGFHRVSLKELMKESNAEKAENGTESESGTVEDNVDGMKLMAAAPAAAAAAPAAEKSLPIVRKQGEGMEGTKMAGLVTRYAKVLNHLIKVKRGSKKKNMVQLLM